jgi:hypothetical protein
MSYSNLVVKELPFGGGAVRSIKFDFIFMSSIVYVLANSNQNEILCTAPAVLGPCVP